MDPFSTFCFYPSNESKLLAGTAKGSLITFDLHAGLDKLLINLQQPFVEATSSRVVHRTKFNSMIRAIKKLDNEHLIVLSKNKGILLFNTISEQFKVLSHESSGKIHHTWRMVVLNDSSFITVGNYNKMIHWTIDLSDFSLVQRIATHSPGHASFCLDLFGQGKVLRNDYSGRTKIYEFMVENVRHSTTYNLVGNMQSAVFLNNDLLVLDYWGRIHVYHLNEQTGSINEIEEFDLSFKVGNNSSFA